MITFKCPNCQKSLKTEATKAGMAVRCRHCQEKCAVPNLSAERVEGDDGKPFPLPPPFPTLSQDDQWFVARNKKKHGPYTSGQLRGLAKSGQLQRTDMLWNEGRAKWFQACQINALFAETITRENIRGAVAKPPKIGGPSSETQPVIDQFEWDGHGRLPATSAPRDRPKQIGGSGWMMFFAITGTATVMCLFALSFIVNGFTQPNHGVGKPELAVEDVNNHLPESNKNVAPDVADNLEQASATVPADSALKTKSWGLLTKLDLKAPQVIALSPDGKLLAIIDDALRIYDAQSGREISLIEEEMPAGTSIQFSPDSTFLAVSADMRPAIRLWHVRNRIVSESFENPYIGVMPQGFPNAGEPYAMRCSLGFVPQGDFLITAGQQTTRNAPARRSRSAPKDDLIVVWNRQTGKPEVTVKGQEPLATASQSPLIAFRGNSPSEAVVWNVVSRQEIARIDTRLPASTISRIGALALSSDGRVLAAVTRIGDDNTRIARFEHQLQLWDVFQKSWEMLPFGNDDKWDEINAIAFSPDGSLLAAAGDLSVDGSRKQVGLIQLWDLETRKIAGLMGHECRVSQIAFSADGKSLVSLSRSTAHEVRVWKEQEGLGAPGVFVSATDEKERLARVSKPYKEEYANRKKAQQQEAIKEAAERVEEMRKKYGTRPTSFAARVLVMDLESYVGRVRTVEWRKGTLDIQSLVFDQSGARRYGPLARGGHTFSMEKAEFAAGSMKDAFQAMLMLRPVQWFYVDAPWYGPCYAFGVLDMTPMMYRSVFGEPHDVSLANQNGRKDHWRLICKDGVLDLVGEIIPDKLVRIENVIVR